MESGIKGGAAAAAVAASADDKGGEDEAADPKLKLRPRPVPKDNFRRVRVVPFPSTPGEIFEALSVFLLYVRSDTGGDGGGESTLTGDGLGPAVESSPSSTEPMPMADIASTAAAAEQGKQTPIDLIQPLVTKQCPPVDACRLRVEH